MSKLTEYREIARGNVEDRVRVRDLLQLLSHEAGRVLEVGTADGYIATRLAEERDSVVALDLRRVEVGHPAVVSVQANAAAMPFENDAFDAVLCAEVLEHVPREALADVCAELSRIARSTLVVGVPFRQDTRVGRATCASCGAKSPAWGHVNTFDEARVRDLFSWLRVDRVSMVGSTSERTNSVATWLMDLAGNPYGEFGPRSQCTHCGQRLMLPPPRSLLQRAFTRLAVYANRVQRWFGKPRPTWIHVRFDKSSRARQAGQGVAIGPDEMLSSPNPA